MIERVMKYLRGISAKRKSKYPAPFSKGMQEFPLHQHHSGALF